MESEFTALQLAGQEAEWLKDLLADVPQWENKRHQFSYTVTRRQQ